MTVPVSELQKISPSSIVELFALELSTLQHGSNDVYRFHAGANLNSNGDLVWAGNTYLRFPLEADGFEYNGNGQLPRPKLRVSNVFGTITAILLTLPNGLEGAKVTRIRTLARYIDAVNFPGAVNPYGTPDTTAEFPREIYYIDRKTAENRDVIEFEMAAAFDLTGVRAPKRQCVANICQWKYRSTECGYTGTAYFDVAGNPVGSSTLDVCGKRLSDCELRFSQLRLLGTATVGSNIITLDAATSIEAGAPVAGFGVPASTTVVGVSGALVTISANATATTSLTKTGTLQTNRTQIILSNVTGLAVGMTVSGPKIPTGATVAAIAGNTITLGQTVNLSEIVALSTTKTGYLWTADTVYPDYDSNYLDVSDTTGLSVGMYVSGPTISLDKGAVITGFTSVSAGTVAVLSYDGVITDSSGTYSFYTVQTQTSQTYTFTAGSRIYAFREDTGIPFGSFPGIGAYFS